MGKPARSTPTVVIRDDGTVYSSHRIRHRGGTYTRPAWDDPGIPTLELPPTEAALAQLGHITRARARRKARR